MVLNDEDYAELVRIGDLKMQALRSLAYRFCEGNTEQQRKSYSRGDLIGVVFEQYLKNKYPVPSENIPSGDGPVFKRGEPMIAVKRYFKDEPVGWGNFGAFDEPRRQYVTEEYRGHLDTRFVSAKRVVIFVHADGREESTDEFVEFRKIESQEE